MMMKTKEKKIENLRKRHELKKIKGERRECRACRERRGL